MSYDNNEGEFEPTAPKKSDVLIQNTQAIAARQQELAEETRLAIARIDEAINLCRKNSEDASYILSKSTEMFEKLEAENAALKQELLYLAKQNENIYSGLTDQLGDIEKTGAVGEPSANGEVMAKIDALGEKVAALSDKVEGMAYDSSRPSRISADDLDSLQSKLDRVLEIARKNESAHSMLADRFEILSMRVEQFGYGGKPQPSYGQPVYPVAMPAAEIDYDKLASKVADILAVRDVVSPDYIASKVAEQIIIPEPSTTEAQDIADKISDKLGKIVSDSVINIDEQALADKVAEKLNTSNIDEDSLADKIVQKLAVEEGEPQAELNEETIADRVAEKINIVATKDGVGAIEINEDSLADKIASRLSANMNGPINEEELSDSIALKVGSLKPEEFEIIVDDAGCASISRDIVEKLDYDLICHNISDKLSEILDINAANAPDYEDMAERISEKITVAGINEDSIADKAAAVLSNYLPELDVDEIADKVTSAVIDVVSAMPQPTLDNETLCNDICDRLIEKQSENDYDIVVDDDGVAKISALVNEELDKNTSARFDKVEEDINKIYDIVSNIVVEEVDEGEQEVDEEEKQTISDMVSNLSERFGDVESKIDNLTDIMSVEEVDEGEETEEESEEEGYEEEEEYVDETAERLDKIYAEVEKISSIVESGFTAGVQARLDEIQEELENVTSLIGDDDSARLERVEDGVNTIKGMLIGGVVAGVAAASASTESVAAEPAEEENEDLVTVSDIVDSDEEEGDFTLGEGEDEEEMPEERMPGEEEDANTDFENMMKYNRSFIARIIQSDDDCKQFYGEIKHALLSYKKVNSNVAWGNERFNKGRETIARIKIRGKTLVVYLALDPNDYKTSVYHHTDVSDNKSVIGTPMMIKVKSPLGVRKAIRLIDEMLEKRGGEKRNVPERDYAAMYPYETIEELIDDGLVKDVRK